MTNKFMFGGQRGTYKSAENVGGKEFSIQYDSSIRCIKLGENTYGEQGSKTITTKLPANGIFKILKMQSYTYHKDFMVLNYFEAMVGDQLIKAGNIRDDKESVMLVVDLNVKFYSINSGACIDSIKFELVSPQNNLAPNINDHLIVGGPTGLFSQIDNVGGKTIIFRTGSDLDSIQIGNHKYGGDGGKEYGQRAILPPDGIFYLKKIQTHKSYNSFIVINYFEADIGNTYVKAGQMDGSAANLEFDTGIPVRFSGINTGSSVDSIQFEVMNLNKIRNNKSEYLDNSEKLKSEID